MLIVILISIKSQFEVKNDDKPIVLFFFWIVIEILKFFLMKTKDNYYEF